MIRATTILAAALVGASTLPAMAGRPTDTGFGFNTAFQATGSVRDDGTESGFENAAIRRPDENPVDAGLTGRPAEVTPEGLSPGYGKDTRARQPGG